ncbi:MAG: DUF819 family protein [Planctomycetota bacterium]|nr:MAG: DUF819 family protein [Planctomycetota bacterium]
MLPSESIVYSWVKSYVLPASLLLMILALDVPGILRLGPRAVIMLLAGTAGVVIGGPIALLITHAWLPDDAWRGMAALSGSWIGGGANMLALKEMFKAGDGIFSAMVVVDVLVANIWMGVLLYAAGAHRRIDAATGADSSAVDELERRTTEFQRKNARIASLPELLTILAIGFLGSWLGFASGDLLAAWVGGLDAAVWKYIWITAVGIVLSFTPARRLEGAGASRVGSVMIYLLVACIGATGDFRKLTDSPALLAMGLIWMAVHVTVLLTTAKLIRAPVFFVAVGSQANIGGAASAPVVASAFHPSLAPVGVLLAVAGYVLGTYAGILCAVLLAWAAGQDPWAVVP